MKKSIKIILVIGIMGLIAGGGVAAYIFFMPHRDIQSVEAFVEVEAAELVKEYLDHPDAANSKYLDEEGESKVIIVSGVVSEIFEDQGGQKVILLKDEGEMMGVSCTFMPATNASASGLSIGDRVRIKGVIRSGAEYDEDLDLAEDAILDKCDVVV